ncbi:uncharacterized protein LOC133892297 [Phragmites australis]|uniref:uncharacterized protein LOC133892297 n=1 Tax=Phragmites australis TaxID=29695 RepID=UPI002D7988E0|nr:uncharacterized protein LOC133892297 [Phragmites australis]
MTGGMDVNFLGQVRIVRVVAPHITARRFVRVVNVGSMVGKVAMPSVAPYYASKAAMHEATDALRVELRPFGVHMVKVVLDTLRSGLGRANTVHLARQEWWLYAGFAATIEE